MNSTTEPIQLDTLTHKSTFRDPADETIKSVYTSEGRIIEITLLSNKKGTDVYCTPTHHYCNLGCKMCHLTTEGTRKEMKPTMTRDIVEAITRTRHEGCEYDPTRRRNQNNKCLISYMGAGEPLLNLKLVEDMFEQEEKIKEFCAYDTMSYALATVMPNKNIQTLTNIVLSTGMPIKVHFSLHSSISEERRKLLPMVKIPVEEALHMLSEYRNKVVEQVTPNMIQFHESPEPIEVHYTLISGINDTTRHLDKTIELLSQYRVPFKILRFNPVPGMNRSTKEEQWIQEIRTSIPGIRTVIYESPGRCIGSSCGSFTKHYYTPETETENERKEFDTWKERYEVRE